MDDRWEQLRNRMVQEQLVGRGFKAQEILRVFQKVPRHLFVPAEYQLQAYEDHPLPIGESQTISQPYIVAVMTELLKIKPEHRILEIGTGSGYQTAILAELGNQVYTIERIEKLSRTAQQVLQQLNYTNIFYRIGDGTSGWPEFAPYDRIIITAATSQIPKNLLEQLSPKKGIMVLPLGEYFQQVLTVVEKDGQKIKSHSHDYCVFVPLISNHQ